MHKIKRILSALLVLVMVFSMIPAQAFAEETEPTTEVDTGDLTIEGTNGFGNLLSEAITEEQEATAEAESEYETGYYVTDLEIVDNVATVTYDSLEDAILVVALYSEDGKQMLTSGKTTVTADATQATVTFGDDMPEYFLASAYLVDTYDLSPLCPAYDTPMYTQEMQELLASTVNDYDPDRVLNLDESEETNFAVYEDSTIVIEGDADVNTVVSVDDENHTYIIANADETITALAKDDVFVYPYGKNEILIVKVAAIKVDGTTATITGSEDLEIEDVFSHVKIEGTGNSSNGTIDGSTATEGIEYLENSGGITPYGLMPQGTESEGISFSIGISFEALKLGEDFANVKWSGKATLSATFAVDYYVSRSYHRIDISGEVSLEGNFGVSGELNVSINLGKINFEVVPGTLTLVLSSDFVVKTEGKVEISLSLSLKTGLIIEHSSKQGFTHDGYCKPDGETKTTFEGSFFVGLEHELAIEIAHGLLADVKVTAEGGREYTLERELYAKPSDDELHPCDICYNGEAKNKFSLEFSAKFLKMERWSIKKKCIGLTKKLYDIYYTPGNMTFFQEGQCPNLSYKLTVNVVDTSENPVKDAAVSVGDFNGATDEKGIVTVFLPVAEYELSVTDGDITRQHNIYMDSAQKVKVRLLPDGTSENFFGSIIPDKVIDDSIVVITGRCGEDLFWNIDNHDRLFISGTGEMWNYQYSDAPWYSDRSSITEVIIGAQIFDNVTSIGDYAFDGCENLSSVEIPDTVTTIGYGAFDSCTSLTSVTIPDSVTTINGGAFSSCTSLSSVTIGNSVTTIGNLAFLDCDNLTSVEIPDSVTTINGGAFSSCTSLSSVTIGNSVTTIGTNAFSSCTSLSSVEIPDSVTTIDGWAFFGCTSLTDIIFRGNAPFIEHVDFDVFDWVSATAYYPAENATWTKDVMEAFGGDITWVPYSLDKNGSMILNEGAAITVASAQKQISEETEPMDVVNESINQGAPTLYAVYDGEYSTVVTDTYTLKTASFSGLVPGEQYVLLAMVSIDVEDPLAASNLLYIDQAAALEDGTLVFQYVQRTATDTSYVVACGASNKDLNDAEITFPEMITDGEVQTVNPTVVYDGKTLTEGQDYTIQGTVSFTEAGTYTCYIRGIRNYAGLVECTYTVISPYFEVASGTCGDNLTWTFYDNGRLTISGTGSMTEFSDFSSVPWDDRRSSIVTVIIDQGVTTISDFAFTECSGLTNVAIGDSVTTIGDCAFDSCTSLTSVTIPDSVTTIGTYAFYDCTNLTSAMIGDGVTSISTSAFQYCSSLTSLTIGASVTTIQYGAFRSCTSLTSVTIPASVTTIGDYVFSGCTSLTGIYVDENNPNYSCDDRGVLLDKEKVELIQAPGAISGSYEIPDSVTTIGSYAFNNCTSLTSVEIPASVTTIGDYVFSGCTSLTGAMIGDGVMSISTGAFQYCSSLTSLTIGASVTTIQDGAFKSCTSLTSVTIPNSVTTIGNDVFKSCTSLTGIYVDENNPNYSSDDQGVLLDKEKVELIQVPGAISGSYEIPVSVIIIAPYAFSGCTSLTSVTIPASVTTISSYAFRSCTSLTSVTIPASVTTIGDYAFSGCTSLSQITFMGDAPAIGGGAFSRVTATVGYLATNPTWTEDVLQNYGGAITWEAYECTEHSYGAVVTEPTCTEQGYTTYTCTKCGDIHVADEKEPLGHTYESATTEDGELNYNCITCGDSYIEATLATLQYAVYEDHVTITGYTGSAEVLVIPAEIEGLPVTTIGSYAFSGHSSLTSVTIADGVTVIGLAAFQDCWMLTNVTIPESVTAIGNEAFMGCESLSSITIPDSVTSIAERVFENCTDLRSIDIPNGVTAIDYRAFYRCVRLSSVTIPESITDISSLAFYGCTNLTSIYFDGHAPAISSSSFEGVTASAYYFANITSWTEDVFQDYGGTITWTGLGETIHPGLEYSVYEDHVEITNYAESVVIEGVTVNTEVLVIPAEIDRLPVTVICDEAFYNHDVLTSVSIPDSVTYIGASAFQYCSSLTTINIPDSVTYIGEFAFAYCENLASSITIPDGITHIGDYAFYHCFSMAGSITIPVSLTSMGTGVFTECQSLTSITIQDGVTNVVDHTFGGCNSVTSITIPDSVISISASAFYDCDSVTSIDIPDSVTFIGDEAFAECSKLTSIRFDGDAPEFGEDVFSGVYGTVYYPGDNPTWTSELMENCNSNSVDWVAEGEVFGMEIVSTPECGIVGLSPDLSELCVELIYGNDIHRPVANSKLTISEIDTTTAGRKNVTVGYDALSAEFTYGVHEATDVVLDSSLYPESEHDYGNNLNETQTLVWPGSECLELVFSEATFVENNFDRLYVYDGEDNLIISYTGAGAAGVTLLVSGDTVKIRLTSDTSITDYGYSFTRITAKSVSHAGAVSIPAVEATCTESGRTEGFICEICDQEQYTVIPELGHSYETVVNKPTCIEQGYTTYTCSVCSDSYVDDYVDALWHDYVDCICIRCGNVMADAECSDAGADGDHKCDECGEACSVCVDGNRDHKCDSDTACTAFSTGSNAHADSATDKDHVCDYGCGAVLEVCADEAGDNDHSCDVCGNVMTDAECSDTGADGDHNCDECGEACSVCVDGDKNHKCDNDTACTAFSTGSNAHADSAGDNDHVCDYGCGAVLEACADQVGDNNHKCDVCGNVMADAECSDIGADGDHNCDECGEACSVCVDGNKDHKCDVCGETMADEEFSESDQVKAFVRRFYTCILNRDADTSGLEWWTRELKEGKKTAAQTAMNFVFSEEFINLKLSNDEFLNRLYATFFDRAADEGGMAYWLNYLDNGVTREYVTAQFVNSAEFEAVCAEYGMQRGSIGLSGYVNLNPNLTMYVVRCYREIHGREADPSGLEYWCEMIATKQRDATLVAKSFVDSQEFVEKNLSNEEYIKVLYRAFMGRESDPSGLAYWVGRLESGTSRLTVLDEFANCQEFWDILANFGV